MKFRLVYEGELRSTQRDPERNQPDPRAAHKQDIRRVFHRQLKQLWQSNQFLREHKLPSGQPNPGRPIADDAAYYGRSELELSMLEVIADKHRNFGYRFVPLVRKDWSLLCSLNVLFLRRDFPGSVIQAGDIDNRLKTLIDALRLPVHKQELAGNEVPLDDEDPFFVLMEDDNLVSHFSVEADTLLEPPKDGTLDKHKVHLVVEVDVRPHHATTFNLSFST